MCVKTTGKRLQKWQEEQDEIERCDRPPDMSRTYVRIPMRSVSQLSIEEIIQGRQRRADMAWKKFDDRQKRNS